MPVQVAIRVDASPRIGTGHVMRCLVLARTLRDHGAQASFICREQEGSLCAFIEAEGFRVLRLHGFREGAGNGESDAPAHAAWLGADWREDAQASIAALAQLAEPPAWLLVDHYALDRRWEQQLRASTRRVMVIDDLADRAHDCDLLLDQNLVANAQVRYLDLVPASCTLLLGPGYALLDAAYAAMYRSSRPRTGPVRRILAFFGGVDAQGLTLVAIDAFLHLGRADLDLDVVIPSRSSHGTEIRARAAGHGNIHLHAGLPSLALLMARSDLAIGAGGVTNWERLCLGLPSIVVATADNQWPIARELAGLGLVRFLGGPEAVDSSSLAGELRDLLSRDELAAWSERCAHVVDGQGADRVAAVMMTRGDSELSLRAAVDKDEALLLEWKNDAGARENAFNPALVSDVAHREWFRSRLESGQACRIFIAETQGGVPIGQVRFDREGDGWRISYSVANQFRGRGLGRRILELGLEAMAGPGVVVRAEVKLDNRASSRIFESLGFSGRETLRAMEYWRDLGPADAMAAAPHPPSR